MIRKGGPMENLSSKTANDDEKKQYFFLEQSERRLRDKLRKAGRAGDKERADALWTKTQIVIEQRKGSVYYQQVVLPRQREKLHT